MSRGVNLNPEPVRDVDLDALFDGNLLCSKAEDVVEFSEERLNATKALVKEVGPGLPVSKKSYDDLVH